MDDTKALDVNEEGTMQLIGHMLDNLINDDILSPDRTGFILITFQPKVEGGTDIKHVSNLSKTQARNGLASTLAGWG